MLRRSRALALGEQSPPSRRALLAAASRETASSWAMKAIRISVFLIAVLLNGDFHPQLLPGGEGSTAQQYIGLLCWLVIIAASFFAPQKYLVDWTFGLYVNLLFLALAIASFLWSENIAASAPKCVALFVVLLGAWRLTLMLEWEEIVISTHDGLFWVGVASIIIALAIPSIGLQATWQHSGQWNGVFVSKQTLGVCGAVQLFQASYLLMNGDRRLYHWLSAGVAIACVLGSGSRGGGALAIAALVSLYIMRVSPAFARAMAFVPLVMAFLAALLIADLLYTQNRYLVVFGAALDFTERTFIWQHALRYIGSHFWLGFGLNGFWTLDWVKGLYLERYSWFLDNYHNGYINVFVETGVIGYALFLLGYFLFGLRTNEIVRRSYFPERQISFGLAYTFLLFQINFTEAFFLRSTNFRATMLTMIVAFTFTKPATMPNSAIGPAGTRRATRTRFGR
jgi:exopolysaccharide production protein ExoQ